VKSHKKSVEGREDIRVITSYLQGPTRLQPRLQTCDSLEFPLGPGGAVGFAELPLANLEGFEMARN
jgi:hypothetical protein